MRARAAMADRVLRVAIAQVAPAWLQREATLDKVLDAPAATQLRPESWRLL